MMSNFKYCPMCGQKRQYNINFCQNCDFKFITGEYVKVEKEDSVINIKKVSQEEFVDANNMIRFNRDKINYLISTYLNNSLTNQFNENCPKNLANDISKYISISLNKEFDGNFDGDYLKSIETILESDDYINSKNRFIQWIDENRTHLPISVLSNYRISIDENIKNLNTILKLDIPLTKENEKFIKILNFYILNEKELQKILL